MDPEEPAAVALSRILTLLTHSWVRGFIFPKTPQPDLLHLAILFSQSSPHPSTGVLNIVTQPTSPDHALDETMHILFVPSFTTGDITVGFQVFERKKTNTVNTSRFYISRMVRDDTNGMFLSVSEHPALGTLELSYGMQMSACMREHALMLFQSGPFLSAIKGLPELDHTAMRNALVYAFYSIEQKSCPVCPTDKGQCTCMIRTRRKRHAQDYDVENANMRSYCGDFNGMATVGAYWNGCKVFRTAACSRVVSGIFRDDGLKQRLAQWGIRELSKVRSINLGRMQVHPVVRAAFFGRGGDMADIWSGFRESCVNSDGGVLDWILEEKDVVEDDFCADNVLLSSAFDLPTLSDASDDNDNNENGDDESGVVSVEQTEMGNVVVVVPKRGRSIPIAPAGFVNHSEERDVNLDDKAWKKELKKRRNRAAAHRSNEKKKLTLEKMKREIKECMEKEKLLRKKEEVLRRENRGLRQAVLQDAGL